MPYQWMDIADRRLQQCLPLAVLKLIDAVQALRNLCHVATVPTACGIETIISPISMANTPGKLQQCLPLAVLKQLYHPYQWRIYQVSCNSAYRLRY